MPANIHHSKERDSLVFLWNGRPMAEVSLTPIRNALIRIVEERGIAVSGVFSSIKSLTKRIARSKLVRKIKSIVTSDAFVDIASTVFPPLGVTYRGVKKAGQLLLAAKKGSETALRAIKSISDDAKAGDPEAQKGLHVLKVVHLTLHGDNR